MPGGVWLVRLDAVDASAALSQVVAETLHVPAAAQLRERLAGAETLLVLDNCEHVVDAVAALVARAARRGAAAARARHQPGAARARRRARAPARAADAPTTRSRCSPAGPASMRRQFVLDADTTARGRGGVPVARRAAAGDRARRGAGAVAVGARHRAPARRPVRPAAGPDQPPAGAAAGPRRRDRVELRAAVPRRPARAVGAVLLRGRAPRWTRPSTCSAPSACRPASVLDTISRLVDRSLVSVDSAEDGAVRYRLLDSIRAFAADRLREAGLAETSRRRAHAAWYAQTAELVRGARAQRAPAGVPGDRAGRDGPTSTPPWPGARARPAARRPASPTGSAGPGSSSATARPAPRGSATRSPSTHAAVGAGRRPPARRLARGVGRRRRPRPGRPRRAPRRIADELADDVLRADVHRHQAFSAIQQGRPDVVLAAATASLATYRRARPGRGERPPACCSRRSAR